MRCPNCLDEYEPHVRRCAACDVALEPAEDAAGAVASGLPLARPASDQPRLLGRFHPQVAPLVLHLVEERGIALQTVTRDDDVEILVDGRYRDELRSELVVRWSELLEDLDPDEDADDLAVGGTSTPGWLDAPTGSFIDRDGRLVVDAPTEEDADRSRTLGPTMVIGGAVLAVAGWQLVETPALVLVGIALALLGVFLPR